MENAIRRSAQLIQTASSGIAFTGAGISTPSGIPDFRSPESGLWKSVDAMAVASIWSFRQDPAGFYEWIYPLAKVILAAEPNPAHYVLAKLEAMGKLKAVVTQNIDMLHTRAGSKTVYELHGHLREATCIHCFTVYPARPIIERFLEDRQVPHCPKCGNVLKPNAILFGEQLPIQQLLAAQNAARQADVMIVIGSSWEVAPASDIPVMAKRNGAKLIIINLEATELDSMADIVIHDDAAVVLPVILDQLESATT
ncbi:MAG: NAD-dependent deacylase [Anaerolineaceae bacterium]|nr:NAD-dependent deacylase [Anaerolineaceae bacterium]